MNTNSLNWLFVGTYTEPILFGTGDVLQGKGEGIYLYSFNEIRGQFEYHTVFKEIPNPSFLCISADKKFLYAVNELKEYKGKKQGAVSSFAIETREKTPFLQPLNTQVSGGTDPCHLTVDQKSLFIFLTNFMSGSCAVFPIMEDGFLGAPSDFHQHEGRGKDPQRQGSPHAHSAVFTPDEKLLLVPDLGVDKLMVYTPDFSTGEIKLNLSATLELFPGAGPRFCEFHKNGKYCYLINELDSSVSLLYYDSTQKRLTIKQTLSTIPANYKGSNICADLHITPNGQYLYASNRGHDSIAAFQIEPDTGMLSFLSSFSSGGKTPRNFSLSPQGKHLLVANQDSDNLVSFSINYNTGELSKKHEIFAPTPVCIKSL